MDLYKKTEDLINILKHKGYLEVSTQLLESVQYSSTGVEVLMKLRYYLNNILREHNNYDEQVVSLAKEILDKITHMLK